jgi:hypothetical protein
MNYLKKVAPILVALCLIAPVSAQKNKPSSKSASPTDLATAKPGRNPNQPIDEEYTKKIKEYLQDPRITTELVDHLPASSTVPTPL